MKVCIRARLRMLIVSSAFVFTASCMQEAHEVTDPSITSSGFSPSEIASQKGDYKLYTGTVAETQYSYDIQDYSSYVVGIISPKELVDCTGDLSGACQRRSFARAGAVCKSDRITGKVQCRITINAQEQVHLNYSDPKDGFRYRVEGSLMFTKHETGQTISACVVSHDFPGRTAAIRFDSNEHVKTGTNGCVGANTAKGLEQQARSAKILTTRRVEWPYETSKDMVTRVDGLYSVAERLLNHMIANKMGPL